MPSLGPSSASCRSTSPEATTFLLAGYVGEQRRAWQHVTHHLRKHPKGVAARTFTSPLALSLARHNYADADTDPTDLLNERAHPTPDALMQHLLSHRPTLAGPAPAPLRLARRAARTPDPIRTLRRRATGRWTSIRREYPALASRWATRAETRETRAFMLSMLVLAGFGVGIVGGIGVGIVGGIAIAIAAGPGHGLVGGLAIGIAFELVIALLIGIIHWIRSLQVIFSRSRTDHPRRDG